MRRREIEEWLRNEEMALREKRLQQQQQQQQQQAAAATTTTTTTQQQSSQPPLKRRKVEEDEKTLDPDVPIKAEPVDIHPKPSGGGGAESSKSSPAASATPRPHSPTVVTPPLAPFAAGPVSSSSSSASTSASASSSPALPGSHLPQESANALLASLCAKVTSLLRALVPSEYFDGRQGVLTPEEIISLPEVYSLSPLWNYN